MPIFLILLSLFLSQSCFAKQDPHQERFHAGPALHPAGSKGPHLFLMVSPKYREKQLNTYNAPILNKINRLEKKIEKYKSKSKDTSKLQKQIEEHQSSLYSPAKWDQSKNLTLYSYVIDHSFNAVEIFDFFLLKKDGGLACKKLTGSMFYIEKVDEQYFKNIYKVKPADYRSFLAVEYDPSCVIKDSTTTKYFIREKKNGKILGPQTALTKKQKDIIKEDFNL
jgi:hypothetical protein